MTTSPRYRGDNKVKRSLEGIIVYNRVLWVKNPATQTKSKHALHTSQTIHPREEEKSRYEKTQRKQRKSEDTLAKGNLQNGMSSQWKPGQSTNRKRQKTEIARKKGGIDSNYRQCPQISCRMTSSHAVSFDSLSAKLRPDLKKTKLNSLSA